MTTIASAVGRLFMRLFLLFSLVIVVAHASFTHQLPNSSRLKSSNSMTRTNDDSDNAPPAIEFQPLTFHHQDIIWQLLSFAAHEDSVEAVKSQACCVPYADGFGTKRGDLGILATLSSNGKPVVGGAWIRMLGPKGMADCGRNDEIPELAMAVFPEYRGQGIGSRMLKELLAKAQQHDVESICLSCRLANVAALKLYKRHGFVKIPNSEKINRVGGTNVSMKVQLN